MGRRRRFRDWSLEYQTEALGFGVRQSNVGASLERAVSASVDCSACRTWAGEAWQSCGIQGSSPKPYGPLLSRRGCRRGREDPDDDGEAEPSILWFARFTGQEKRVGTDSVQSSSSKRSLL